MATFFDTSSAFVRPLHASSSFPNYERRQSLSKEEQRRQQQQEQQATTLTTSISDPHAHGDDGDDDDAGDDGDDDDGKQTKVDKKEIDVALAPKPSILPTVAIEFGDDNDGDDARDRDREASSSPSPPPQPPSSSPLSSMQHRVSIQHPQQYFVDDEPQHDLIVAETAASPSAAAAAASTAAAESPSIGAAVTRHDDERATDRKQREPRKQTADATLDEPTAVDTSDGDPKRRRRDDDAAAAAASGAARDTRDGGRGRGGGDGGGGEGDEASSQRRDEPHDASSSTILATPTATRKQPPPVSGERGVGAAADERHDAIDAHESDRRASANTQPQLLLRHTPKLVGVHGDGGTRGTPSPPLFAVATAARDRVDGAGGAELAGVRLDASPFAAPPAFCPSGVAADGGGGGVGGTSGGGGSGAADDALSIVSIASSSRSSRASPSLQKQSSLMSVLGVTSTQEALLALTSFDALIDAMRRAGLETTNLIFGESQNCDRAKLSACRLHFSGIDYTGSILMLHASCCTQYILLTAKLFCSLKLGFKTHKKAKRTVFFALLRV